MDFERLYEIILTIYTDCKITEFPIDCFDVVRNFGYRIMKYSELTQKKKTACMRLSSDSCIVGDTLYYQDHNLPERTRFSMMHELGHVFLGTAIEEAADTFSSHILAPRIIIHKSGCRTADQIHAAFGLSYTASNRALADYKTWFDRISHSVEREPLPVEKKLERMFFPIPAKAAHRSATPRPVNKRLTKRQREMDERAAFFQELRILHGEEYVFHMLENEWLGRGGDI